MESYVLTNGFVVISFAVSTATEVHIIVADNGGVISSRFAGKEEARVIWINWCDHGYKRIQ